MVYFEDVVNGNDWLAHFDPRHAPDARSGTAAQREAGERGQGVRMQQPREGGDDEEEFHAPPQPPRPAKAAARDD